MKFEAICELFVNSLFVNFFQLPHGTLQCQVDAIYKTYKDRHKNIALEITKLIATFCDYDPFQSCSFIAPLPTTNVSQVLRTLVHRSRGVK